MTKPNLSYKPSICIYIHTHLHKGTASLLNILSCIFFHLVYGKVRNTLCEKED